MINTITISDLYYQSSEKNLTETAVTTQLHDSFYKKYIEPLEEWEQEDKMASALNDLLYESREAAFEAGFKTAVGLLMGGRA